MKEKKTKICHYCGKEITDDEEYVVMDGGELYHTGCLDRKELMGSGISILMVVLSVAILGCLIYFFAM